MHSTDVYCIRYAEYVNCKAASTSSSWFITCINTDIETRSQQSSQSARSIRWVHLTVRPKNTPFYFCYYNFVKYLLTEIIIHTYMHHDCRCVHSFSYCATIHPWGLCLCVRLSHGCYNSKKKNFRKPEIDVKNVLIRCNYMLMANQPMLRDWRQKLRIRRHSTK